MTVPSLNVVTVPPSKAEVSAFKDGPYVDFSDPKTAASVVTFDRFMWTDGVDAARKAYFWRNEFWVWDGVRYHVLPIADVRELLYRVGHYSNKPLRKRHVDDVIDALRAILNLSDAIEPCCWLQGGEGQPNPSLLIPMANGLFCVDTRTLLKPTPLFFAMHGLPYAYDPDAPAPVRFHTFLRDVWADDEASKRLLQQWFGYCLLALTLYQKILMLVGPIRSGKGTIVRLLQSLLGKENTASPTLGSLAQPFGLAPLVGKLLAIVSDVRLSGRVDISTVVENLLRISGEDAVTIARKYLPDLTVTLHARLMLVTNEIPWFADASGAIASRFLVLQTTRSFFDKEDVYLTDALIGELPAIFLWALDGLEDLQEAGRFVQPESGVETREQMGLLASPVKAFVDAVCEIGDPAAETAVGDLFSAWSAWSQQNGYKHAGSAQTFGRDLRAALPSLRVAQHRVTGGNLTRFYVGIRLKEST